MAASTRRERQQATAADVWHRLRSEEQLAESEGGELVSAGRAEIVGAGAPPKARPPANDVDDFVWGAAA